MSKMELVIDTICMMIDAQYTDDEIVQVIGCPVQIVQELREDRA